MTETVVNQMDPKNNRDCVESYKSIISGRQSYHIWKEEKANNGKEEQKSENVF